MDETELSLEFKKAERIFADITQGEGYSNIFCCTFEDAHIIKTTAILIKKRYGYITYKDILIALFVIYYEISAKYCGTKPIISNEIENICDNLKNYNKVLDGDDLTHEYIEKIIELKLPEEQLMHFTFEKMKNYFNKRNPMALCCDSEEELLIKKYTNIIKDKFIEFSDILLVLFIIYYGLTDISNFRHKSVNFENVVMLFNFITNNIHGTHPEIIDRTEIIKRSEIYNGYIVELHALRALRINVAFESVKHFFATTIQQLVPSIDEHCCDDKEESIIKSFAKMIHDGNPLMTYNDILVILFTVYYNTNPRSTNDSYQHDPLDISNLTHLFNNFESARSLMDNEIIGRYIGTLHDLHTPSAFGNRYGGRKKSKRRRNKSVRKKTKKNKKKRRYYTNKQN